MKGNWIWAALSAIMSIAAVFSSFWGGAAVIFFLLVYIVFRKGIMPAVVSLLAVIFFSTLTAYHLHNNVTKLTGSEQSFTGKVVDMPKIDGDQLAFSVRLTNNEKVQVLHKIKSSQNKQRWRDLSEGETCTFTGELLSPDVARNEYAFNYRKYLNRKFIYWQVKTTHVSRSSCFHTRETFFQTIKKYRARLLRKIDEQFPKEQAGIIQAMVLGDRSQIDEEILSLYQQLGLMHVLVISGLHVGVATAFVYFLLLRAGVTREKSALIVVSLLIVYTVLAGAAPSVIRAASMTSFALLSTLFYKRLSPLDSISITCLLMLSYHPYYLYHPGFQLSFLISTSLILSSTTILAARSFWIQLFYVTVCAQLAALPVVLFHFFEISLLSIPVNILFVPFTMAVILPIANIAVISLYLPMLQSVIKPVFAKLLTLSEVVLKAFSNIEGLSFVFGRQSLIVLGLGGLITASSFILWEHKKHLQSVLLLFVFWTVVYISPIIFDRDGEVRVIDVGQGESILIALPHQKITMLIDAGGFAQFQKEQWQQKHDPFEPGKDIVVPFLKAHGIRELDFLVLTHPDADHIGGAPAVIKEIPVKSIIVNGKRPRTETEEEIYKLAKMKNIPIYEAHANNMLFSENSNEAVILYPEKEREDSNENNQSLVILMKLGQQQFLFTGDLEEAGERRLLEMYPTLKVDVLKIGHHGSKTSSSESFIGKLRPETAIISAGADNRFGHPHPLIIKRLHEMRVLILRTDQLGGITYYFTGDEGTFSYHRHILD